MFAPFPIFPLTTAVVDPPLPPTGDTGKTGPVFRQQPAPVGNPILTTPANFVSIIESASPGQHILLATGQSYVGLEFTVTNADPINNPIIVRPENPNVSDAQYPQFTGRTNVRGQGVQFWGCWFDGRGSGNAGHKTINCFDTQDVGFLYCRITPAAIGLEILGSVVQRPLIHRCRVHLQDIVSGTNGGNAFKFGDSDDYRTDYIDAICDYTLVEGFNQFRETWSLKSAGWHIYRCHDLNGNDLAFRQATDCIVEECRCDGTTGNRKIQVSGSGHQVINCYARLIELDSGTVDGTTVDIATAPGSFRPSCNDAQIINCEAEIRTEVGHLPFNQQGNGKENAKRNLIRNPTGPVVLTQFQESTTQAAALDPAFPEIIPITLAPADVGLDAYRTSAGL